MSWSSRPSPSAGTTASASPARSAPEPTGELTIEDAALYQALHRLERQGLIAAEWGLSENNRRARFYRLTHDGRQRLRAEVSQWRRYAEAVFKVLEPA